MNLIKKLTVFIFIVFCSHILFSQNGVGVQLNKGFIKTERFGFYYHPIFLMQNNISQKPESNALGLFPKNIDQSSILFNCSDLAPFCRLELKMEKAAKFPVKFRIGEVQYVERMEGKYD